MYGVTFSDKILNSVAQTLISTVKNAGNIYRSSGANFIISFKDMSRMIFITYMMISPMNYLIILL